MFQILAHNVNEKLRDVAENQNGLFVSGDQTYLELVEKLATNLTKTQTFLDTVWKKFENFSEFSHHDEIFELLREEVKFVDNECDTWNGKPYLYKLEQAKI